MTPTTISLIQIACDEDSSRNLKKALEQTKQAAGQGAQVVALPELFLNPYFPQEEKCDAASFAEPIPGPTTEILSQLAKELKIVLVAGSLYENANGTYYNTSVIFGQDGATLGKYRKIHIPQDPQFYEKNYFTPGDDGYLVVKTPFGKIAVLICYDQWFPEAARSVALQGADIIFYPTAIGTMQGVAQWEGNWPPATELRGPGASETRWVDAWTTVQRGHAIANSTYVAAINRVGTEKSLDFWGGSFICGPFGEIVAQANNQETILTASCDLSRGAMIDQEWGFSQNRRPDTYQALVKK